MQPKLPDEDRQALVEPIAIDGNTLALVHPGDVEPLLVDGDEAASLLAGMSATEKERFGRQERLLTRYCRTGDASLSASLANVGLRTHNRWLEEDTYGYRSRFRLAVQAWQHYTESLAVHRVQNPEGNRGSDTLLIALNNANNPDKWRGNQASIVVEDSVLQALASLQKLDAETRAELPAPDPSKVIEGEATVERFPWE